MVKAHAGHGSLDAAEKALDQAEANARTAKLKAEGGRYATRRRKPNSGSTTEATTTS